ncbi:hypothetical protein SCOR_02670 [Sulfidibacter corallicola]|uniref:Uncharacterized protein n=1 Tax=Sulfidibacter corallicola TaxID=2818388 RepID=A0A8A4TF40_SULCO|nr:hypothetical protein [Sulfidibacter corallicola]QTD48566.1 hypothetical protein J3U87_23545 [Sulfidibacter corallicola]
MTKRTYRQIIVGNQQYRYSIGTPSLGAGYFRLRIWIWEKTRTGAELKVEGSWIRDFWLDAPGEIKRDRFWYKHPAIQPRHIARMIQRALYLGWKPMVKGSPFILVTEDDPYFENR